MKAEEIAKLLFAIDKPKSIETWVEIFLKPLFILSKCARVFVSIEDFPASIPADDVLKWLEGDGFKTEPLFVENKMFGNFLSGYYIEVEL